MHWAAQYIGTPWRLGCEGPDAFDCWGLVRHVQRSHFGREIPVLDREHGARVGQAKSLMRSWKRTANPATGDVMLCHSPSGPHVGVVLEADGAVGVLHAMGSEASGSVVYTPIREIEELGFSRPEFWTQHVY